MPKFTIRNFEELEYQSKEALNELCAKLSFAGGDIKKIMITSSHPQEGKSFVTMNLLRTFASLGYKVVLVDADIRASQLQKAYDIRIEGVENPTGKYPGLSRYLAGNCKAEEILGGTNIPNAYMILAGNTVSNSMPLLKKTRLRELLNALSKRFDIVLVDAPPVGTIIDAAQIATCCDGTLFVVQSDAVSRSHLINSLHKLEQADCPLLGTVLNQYDDRDYANKYYYSGNYYYNRYNPYESQERPRKKQPQRRAPQPRTSTRKGR